MGSDSGRDTEHNDVNVDHNYVQIDFTFSDFSLMNLSYPVSLLVVYLVYLVDLINFSKIAKAHFKHCHALIQAALPLSKRIFMTMSRNCYFPSSNRLSLIENGSV